MTSSVGARLPGAAWCALALLLAGIPSCWCTGTVQHGPGGDASRDGGTHRGDTGIDDADLGDSAPLDTDGDGIRDLFDICPYVADPDQADGDGDLRGDGCDNCPEVANYEQEDENGNGTGDACESSIDPEADDDGDGVANNVDNCWRVANANQLDADADSAGDACDNCPIIANWAQTDTDSDGTGDACEIADGGDDDGDGVANEIDNCPGVGNADQADGDSDTIGDACDNCVETANVDQVDADIDGIGDACEEDPWDPTRDTDGDGAPDVTDNCAGLANPSQTDSDGDHVGDDCDNCPTTANYNQVDLDGNGIGDACEIPSIPSPCAENEVSGEYITPNLYFVIDTSGSMTWIPCRCDQEAGRECAGDPCPPGCGYCGTRRWIELRAGLTAIANDLTRDFNVGLAAFPVYDDSLRNEMCGTCMPADPPHCTPSFERLPMQAGHSAAEFTGAYTGIDPNGSTPTTQALNQVRIRRLYEFAGDTVPTRPKAVVLITDGEPNCGGDVGTTADAAAALFAAGVPVYLIGFANLNATDMDQIAEAGLGIVPSTPGVNDWYSVADSASIVSALRSIASAVMGCSVTLTLDGDEDPSRLRIESVIDGTATPIAPDGTNGFTFDSGTSTATLHGTACTDLQDATRNGHDVRVHALMACATCTPAEEACDYVDNNCNGIIDEGCCPAEICDGADNDCDGVIDNGCPPAGCIPSAEICDGIDNNCNGETDEGCPPPGCIQRNERCNGIDDDCDTIVDEGCTPGCVPTNEVCDGVDNDCDGLVDEGCRVNPPIE